MPKKKDSSLVDSQQRFAELTRNMPLLLPVQEVRPVAADVSPPPAPDRVKVNFWAPVGLIKEAKQLALDQDTTLTDVCARALSELLQRARP